MKKYDVIVAGGGFSGVGAAIAAARNGMQVLIIEKSNALGGAATVNMVNPFMPYYTYQNGERTDLSRGIFLEIKEKINESEAFLHNSCANDSDVFNEEILKLILNRMVINEGVDILFHSFIVGVNTDSDKIKSVTVANKTGLSDFEADFFIDCTGDADIAVKSGNSYRLGRDNDHLCQPMTLNFRLSNVHTEYLSSERPEMQRLYKQYQAEGKIKNPRENILYMWNTDEHVIHFNSTRIVGLDPTDPFDLTKAEIEAREQAYELYVFLKSNFRTFADSVLSSTGSEIGVRESRMINGLYTMTADDVINCTEFDDAIAFGNYEIDLHSPDGSGTYHCGIKGICYGIPYRCLVPDRTTNLLVAGRSISVTHEAQAAIRIMPIVCCLGEAAGYAAALAVKNNTSAADVDAEKIKAILKAHDAIPKFRL